MTFRDLQTMVAKGEGLQIEFKHKLPEWPKLVREVVAFANTQGGTVLVGVQDDGVIAGVKDPREIEEAILLNLNDWIRPAPAWSLEVVPLNRKRAVVAIVVPKSSNKPHFARTQLEDEVGHALIRIADASTRASKETVELLRYEGKERDMKVEIGEKERLLMQHLSKASCITVDQFCALAGINRATASRTLVHLVKANVLAHQPQVEEPDTFYPK